MNNKRYVIVIIIVIVSLLVVIYLYKRTTRDDFGIFGEGKRTPPCWWNICAGEVYDRGGLLSLIRSDARISHITENNDTEAVMFTITDSSKHKTVNVSIDLSYDSTISLYPSSNYDISLKELIDKYGTPSYVYPRLDTHNLVMFELFYPQMGLDILTKVYSITNNEPVLYDTMLVASIMISGTDDNKVIMLGDDWVDWHGYGAYKVE